MLKFWLDKCDWDFNEAMLEMISEFIDGPLSRDGHLGLVKQLRNLVNKVRKRRAGGGEEENHYVHGVPPPDPRVPRNLFASELKLVDLDEIEIARQLSLMDYDLFVAVKPFEFLNMAWLDLDKHYRAPHLCAILERAQYVQDWVVFSIQNIAELDKKKDRKLKMVEKWLKVCEVKKKKKWKKN